tara:strand:- start:480 stop:1082 length:603 start_codon:yes stop_codon:yes gene_type:complete
MNKSQFNIKISTDLLSKVKRQAIISGKSLTEHITDLVKKSLSEDNVNNLSSDSVNKVKDLEERLLRIESTVRNREYLSKNLKPFTNTEAVKCTEFMKGVFDQQVEKRNFDNKSIAFEDLFNHIKVYDQISQTHTERLKEIMISDSPSPWTAKELNDLVGEDKCNCPIRKALINWTGIIDCPSQQEICDKGVECLLHFRSF